MSAQPAAAAAPQPQVAPAAQVRSTRPASGCDSCDHQLTGGISLSLVAAASAQATSNLLDLDLLGDGPSTPAAAPVAGGGSAADDILSLFGPSSTPAAAAAPAARPAPAAVAVDPLADLLGGVSLSAPAPAAAAPAQPAGVVGYNKNGVVITFTPQRDTSNPALVNVTCAFQNGSPAMLTNFVFQAAVPKVLSAHRMVSAPRAVAAAADEPRAGLWLDARPGSQTQKLQMMPASSNVLPPGGSATQLIRVLGADGVGTQPCTAPWSWRIH